MRSLAEKITFEPQNSFPPIRFIVVLAVLVGGSWSSWSEVFSAAVFKGQLSTDAATTGSKRRKGTKQVERLEQTRHLAARNPQRHLLRQSPETKTTQGQTNRANRNVSIRIGLTYRKQARPSARAG
jgi:hypothetical protein